MQKQREVSWSIIGTDVESLFLSLSDVECAKIVRNAILNTKMEFNSVDFKKALVYLRIVGGTGYLVNTKIKRWIPVWKVKRPDLVSIMGELSKDLNNWKFKRGELREWEKREIVARTVEVAVLVTMGTHVYSFEDRILTMKFEDEFRIEKEESYPPKERFLRTLSEGSLWFECSLSL